jgi:Gluconate 2-dehydrogenase subunit 3
MREAWRSGLAALDDEAKARQDRRFHELGALEQDAILTGVQSGDVRAAAWRDLPPRSFFKRRVLHDIVSAYYAHPTAWNEIGFGGPASPRGYVRMYFDRRDPWEASEARPGREARARRENTRVG